MSQAATDENFSCRTHADGSNDSLAYREYNTFEDLVHLMAIADCHVLAMVQIDFSDDAQELMHATSSMRIRNADQSYR